MLESCDLLVDHLPPEAKEALGTAKREWATGHPNTASLERVRVQCWRYIDGASKMKDANDPSVCATRALICVLYPAWEEDPFDLLHLFIELTQKAGAIDDQQQSILSRLFLREV
jgi:hypothetical protein